MQRLKHLRPLRLSRVPLRDTAGGSAAQSRPRKPLDDTEGHHPAQLELYFKNLFLATVRRGIWARRKSCLNEDKGMDERVCQWIGETAG